MNINQLIYNIANSARKIGFDFHEARDRRVVFMKKEINRLGKLEFKIEQYPDGSWVAESVNIDGIITGGKITKNIPLSIRDAVFTYFEIPAHLCVDSLLKADNEPVTTKQHVYA